MSLTADELRDLMDYDPNTGIFRWRKHTWRRKAGPVGAPHKDGYLQIKITIGRRRKKSYLLHRLAWLYVHGEWPAQLLDHRNLDRQDNRIANLREADRTQNAGNSRARRNNTSGFKGVSFHKRDRHWRAQIKMDGKNLILGYFTTAEAAHRAYCEAAKKVYGEFARVA